MINIKESPKEITLMMGHITEVIEEIIKMAKAENVPLRMVFNEVKVDVYPDSFPEDIYQKWVYKREIDILHAKFGIREFVSL